MNSGTGYYVFSINGEYYLYDMVGMVIFQIDESLFSVLCKTKNNESLTEAERAIVNIFKQNGFLKENIEKPEVDPTEKNVAYLSFAPTYKCNFRCSYCFGGHGDNYTGVQREFTNETLCEMLDFFFNIAFPMAKRYRIDFVSGGEPLMGINIIKATIEYIEKHICATGKLVSMWLCTNGSLISDEIIEYLSEHNVSIGISLDGRKEYNDRHRVDAFGNGTYVQICKGISLVKNNTNASKKIKEIWGLCTATNENCDFVDILRHMKSLGFKNVQIRLIRSEASYEIEKIVGEYNKLADFLLEQFSDGNVDYLRMILNDNDQFGKVLKRILLDRVLVRRCNAGVNKVTICPDGSIYPCDSLVGMPGLALGNIHDISWDKERYPKMTVDMRPKCSNCEIRYLCGGDCCYNSILKTGCQFIPDVEFCKLQRHIIHLTIMLRYKMQKTNEFLYERFVKEEKRKNDYSEFFG